MYAIGGNIYPSKTQVINMETYPQDYIPRCVKKHKIAASILFLWALFNALGEPRGDFYYTMGNYVGSFVGAFILLWIWSLIVGALSKKDKDGK